MVTSAITPTTSANITSQPSYSTVSGRGNIGTCLVRFFLARYVSLYVTTMKTNWLFKQISMFDCRTRQSGNLRGLYARSTIVFCSILKHWRIMSWIAGLISQMKEERSWRRVLILVSMKNKWNVNYQMVSHANCCKRSMQFHSRLSWLWL